MSIISNLKKKILKKYINLYFDNINYEKSVNNLIPKKKSKNYIIATRKKRGFFSLVLFVLNHLKYCEKKNLVPLIDMENFKTIYNEKQKIFGTYNAWEYYFKKINNLNLQKVYSSKKFILSVDKNIFTVNNKFNKNLKKYFTKNFKITNQIKHKIDFYKKKLGPNYNNILGIHFRGTDMCIAPNHPTPPYKYQIVEKIKFYKKKYDINKLFLVTEDLENYKFIKKKFGRMVISINNFRSNQTKVFNLNNRKNHRYKMGEEALINSYLLSYCKIIISSQTGISDFAKFINKDLKLIKIDNGFNSSSIFISYFQWKFKNFLYTLKNLF